jgi:site-specific DNA-methyltransferase (cytosine-N4-specific)
MIYYRNGYSLPDIKNNSAHLIITSPPYPMIEKWDESFGVVDFDKQHAQLQETWKESYRVLIDGGILCINIGDATRKVDGVFQCFPNYAKTVMMCREIGFFHLIPILWKKISNRPNAFLGSGFIPTNGYISQDCEYILIFRKGGPRKFEPKDELRYASSFTKEERDVWFSQTWNIPGNKNAKHDSSFPDEVPIRLIRMFSVIGDTVLDPFVGTGTTVRVAEQLGRVGIGYSLPKL